MADDLTAPQGYNPQYHQNVIDQAKNAAQKAYNEGMLQYQREELAFRKAQEAWKEVTDKAGLTGMYEGQWSMPSQQYFASTFGTWGAPTAGQQTLAGQQQQWQQAYDTASQYGQYYGLGQAPAAGTQTQAAQEQQYTQWLRSAQEARANQALQQQTAQNYLNLLSQLRGPADWAKYQQVLGATPGGMRDLVSAAMGQYVPGGGATTGYQPQAASLQTLQQQIGGYGAPGMYTQGAGGQQYGGPYTGGGGPTNFAEGTYGYDATGRPGTGTPQEAAGGGTNTMGNLPAPNQIAAQSWKNLAPSQQQMIMGQYEAQGWNKDDVQALLNQSLPRYATNAPGAGTFRLR